MAQEDIIGVQTSPTEAGPQFVFPTRIAARAVQPGAVASIGNVPVPSLTPAQLAIISTPVPSFVEIINFAWGPDTGQPVTNFGTQGGSGSVYAQPRGQVSFEWSINKGAVPFTDAILVTRIGDGVIATFHTAIELPSKLSSTLTGTILTQAWPSPFPPTLYGFHQLQLELWAVNPNGKPLPASSQAATPDNRNFTFQSNTWVWVELEPGCRKDGGLMFSELQGWSVQPTNLLLDATGKTIAPGQSVKVTWTCVDSGFKPTQYGYRGSWQGVDIFLPDGTAVFNAAESNSVTIDLSGKAFTYEIAIAPSDPSGCGFSRASQTLTGTIQGAPPPTKTLADLFIPSVDIFTLDTPPVAITFPEPGQSFQVIFTVENGGQTTSSPCVVRLSWDWGGGPQTSDLQFQGIAYGAWQSAILTVNGGLAEGSYDVDCIVDVNNSVTESNKGNNQSSIGIIVST